MILVEGTSKLDEETHWRACGLITGTCYSPKVFDVTQQQFMDLAHQTAPILPLPCIVSTTLGKSRTAKRFRCIDDLTSDEWVKLLIENLKTMHLFRVSYLAIQERGTLLASKLIDVEGFGQLWAPGMTMKDALSFKPRDDIDVERNKARYSRLESVAKDIIGAADPFSDLPARQVQDMVSRGATRRARGARGVRGRGRGRGRARGEGVVASESESLPGALPPIAPDAEELAADPPNDEHAHLDIDAGDGYGDDAFSQASAESSVEELEKAFDLVRERQPAPATPPIETVEAMYSGAVSEEIAVDPRPDEIARLLDAAPDDLPGDLRTHGGEEDDAPEHGGAPPEPWRELGEPSPLGYIYGGTGRAQMRVQYGKPRGSVCVTCYKHRSCHFLITMARMPALDEVKKWLFEVEASTPATTSEENKRLVAEHKRLASSKWKQ